MKNSLHDLATMVGFEIVNVDDGFTNYEFNQKVNGVESVSTIVKVLDEMPLEKYEMTFDAIVNVLPRKFKKRIYKLVKHSNIAENEKSIELVMFAIEQFKEKCEYNKLKEYGHLLGVDIEELGYGFTYSLTKNDAKSILAKIEQKVPIEVAAEVGKIRKIEYKIGYVKNMKKKDL